MICYTFHTYITPLSVNCQEKRRCCPEKYGQYLLSFRSAAWDRSRLLRRFSPRTKGLHGPFILGPLLLQTLFQDHIFHLSKTLVQISTNSSKMTLFGRRVVTINLVERWLIHPNPGPVMSPLCQFSHPFLHLFPDYLRSDI